MTFKGNEMEWNAHVESPSPGRTNRNGYTNQKMINIKYKMQIQIRMQMRSEDASNDD